MEAFLISSMLSIADTGNVMLVTGGFVVGVLSVVFGGGLFFSVPLMQWVFPSLSFGSIVGNIKVGSLFRSIGSTWTTRGSIEYVRNIEVSTFAFLGTILGAFLISHLSQAWILPATVFAVVFAESAPRITAFISGRTFHVAAFLCGLYAGTFGAGIGIILVALLRLKHPTDTDIALVKIQARFVEFMLVSVAVVTHWYGGNLLFAVWLPWSVGSLAGGYVGGILLIHLSKFSGALQKIVLRIAYALAIITATIHL